MNYLVRDRGRYFFRVRIPKDLCTVFNRKEIKKALHTKAQKNAKVIAKAYCYKLEKLFTLARLGIVTEVEIQNLMREFVNETLGGFEEGLSIHPTSRNGEKKMTKAYLLMQEEGRTSLVRNDITGVQP